MLTEEIKTQIKDHALQYPYEEVCGFILSNKEIYKCKNLDKKAPEKHFIISGKEVERAQKTNKIIAVYHSHCKIKEQDEYYEAEDGLSDGDIQVSNYYNLPFIMYNIVTDKFYQHNPIANIEISYLERPYMPNLLDEIQLIIDYYQRELNINLERKSNIKKFLKDNGFGLKSDLKKGDIILVKWGGDIKKFRLLIYLGDNNIIMHPKFESPKKTEYNYGMQKWAVGYYRHSKM